MPGPNEPNDENLRVDVPLPTPGKSPDPNIKSRETVRIQLPLRESAAKVPVHTPAESRPSAGPAAHDVVSSQFSEPVRSPSFSPPLSASVMPPPDSPVSGPQKETLRVPLAPESLRSAGQMKSTPSAMATPHIVPQNLLIAAASREKSSLLLCWILLGISALILLIQIWTYLS
ncbi:MAG: hypothetical protein DME98_12535 [Verrucomicrobia bacterium]|nr:MAG: hypothetical protein DME98_12535 [Verrucomicrobiota bacterium]PYJ34045.1 MAG: hypothetical protein DME88_06450 [Verrucomicrobiota bacterium]